MLYCINCKRKVEPEPVHSLTDTIIFILVVGLFWGLFIGWFFGIILSMILFATVKTPNMMFMTETEKVRCPICRGENFREPKQR